MKHLDKIKSVLLRSCVIFTVCTLIIYAVAEAAYEDAVPRLSSLFLIFVYAVLVCMTGYWPAPGKMKPALLRGLRFLLRAAGFFVMFILIPGNVDQGRGEAVITAMALFCFGYAVAAGVHFSVQRTKRARESGRAEYKAMFPGAKDKK